MLKGAPEVVLPRCRFADPQADQDHAESLVHNLAEQGLRVLAVAQAQLEPRHRRRETPMPMPSTPPRRIWS